MLLEDALVAEAKSFVLLLAFRQKADVVNLFGFALTSKTLMTRFEGGQRLGQKLFDPSRKRRDIHFVGSRKRLNGHLRS